MPKQYSENTKLSSFIISYFVYNFQVKICEAKGLPKDLSNFVFCQYSFWGHDDPISVPPEINPDTSKDKKDSKCIKFNHERVRSMEEQGKCFNQSAEGAVFGWFEKREITQLVIILSALILAQLIQKKLLSEVLIKLYFCILQNDLYYKIQIKLLQPKTS